MTRIRKAVFPVAGLGTRFLPATKVIPKEMLALVDKPLIQYAVEEAQAAGIEDFIFVTGRGKVAIEDHFDHAHELEATLKERGKVEDLEELKAIIPPAGRNFYTRQLQPLGLGHAVWCAHHLVGDEPFAVLLADDFIMSSKPCLQQMVEGYQEVGGNMVAIMNVAPEQTPLYGVVDGQKVGENLIEIKGMVEKPLPGQAPSNMAIIGRYILQPEVFKHLEYQKPGVRGEIQLTDALTSLLGVQPFHGLQFSGKRFDCGSKLGLLTASIQVALHRADLKDALFEELEVALKAYKEQNA
jgi:UTP--glucose-1-phosphate uridylyltransferase